MFYRICTGTGIELKSFNTFHQVADEWRKLLPDNHHLQCKDIEALEHSMPADIQFRYVNIYENQELIGVMYLQCLHFSKKHYNNELLDRPFIRSFKSIVLRTTADILICGNIFRVNFQGFYFREKAHRERIFNYLHLYRQMVKKEKNFCGILVKDCSREFSPAQFGCHGFKAFNQDLTMEMNIRPEWENFDHYTSDLSRKYRQRAIKIRASLANVEVLDLDLERLTLHKDRINELYTNIVKQQTLALGILNPDYFLQMKKNLGKGFAVKGYFYDGRLIAFSSHIYYFPKQKMEIHYIGLDYAYNQQFNLYFNILFDGITTAIEQRFTLIEMGRTAREAKANAGAHAVENFNYIWLRPGITRLALKIMGRWFESSIGDEWKKRNPFKSNVQNEAIQATV